MQKDILTNKVEVNALVAKQFSHIGQMGAHTWSITDKNGANGGFYDLYYDVDNKIWRLSFVQFVIGKERPIEVTVDFTVNGNKANIKRAWVPCGSVPTTRAFKADKYLVRYAPIVYVFASAIAVGYFTV